MIATVSGVLAGRDGETVIVETEGGVGYAIAVPLPVFERLPAAGSRVRLFTELVVREDGWSLYGFDRPVERAIFQRLLGASGFGPRLALALLSALGPERTVRGIRERDIAVLSTVSGIGRKKAERLILELQDRFGDLPDLASATVPPPGADQAVRALTGLGYPPAAAEDAVRNALANGGDPETSAVVRRALQVLATRK
ncbi:MAG TPA: Holliday junction branch migration protein RuvA [Gemmatimonadales bacterium]|nr:Holliday junction branch migration protein RuvA [Gemmatimonadales bacterium]